MVFGLAIALLTYALVDRYQMKVEVQEKPIVTVSDDQRQAVAFAQYRVKQRGLLGEKDTDVTMTVMEVL